MDRIFMKLEQVRVWSEEVEGIWIIRLIQRFYTNSMVYFHLLRFQDLPDFLVALRIMYIGVMATCCAYATSIVLTQCDVGACVPSPCAVQPAEKMTLLQSRLPLYTTPRWLKLLLTILIQSNTHCLPTLTPDYLYIVSVDDFISDFKGRIGIPIGGLIRKNSIKFYSAPAL